MFLIKTAPKKKKRIKKAKTNKKRKAEKSEKEKNEAKGKQSKKSIKEICQGNYDKIYTMFQTKRRDCKTKNKYEKYSIIVLFLREDVEENGTSQGLESVF